MLAQLADLNSLDRRAYEYILEVLKVQIYTENRVWESNAWSEFCLEHWLIIHLFVIHLIDYKMLTNVCKFFSHWNYTIWYNKTLLAWYFKEKHWHSHWGDTKWSPAAFFFFFNRFCWDWRRVTCLCRGNVLCHTKEKRLL